MKILIDASGITREKAGVGVYAKNLLDELTRTEGANRYFILAQDDDPEMDFSGRPNVKMLWVPARLFRLLPLRFLLEQIYLPFLLRSRRIDILHSLHYAFPLFTFGTKRVVTFHDMTFFTMPEVHQRLKVIYFQTFMRASVKRAEALIFISHSALRDCTLRLGPPQGIATVVPHGKADAFRSDIPATLLEHVRQKYGLSTPFVLYVGTIEPRKNLPRLVEAFSLIAATDPQVQLVLAGKMGWMADELLRTIEKLNLASRIVFTGFVAEEDKPALLAASTLFVYPSLYEGFGLPALEALACGVPTITSNLSSLPEVVGDAALLIDPTDVPALSAAIRDLLHSPELRQQLRVRGIAQAAHFTWTRTASQTAQVYEALQRP